MTMPTNDDLGRIAFDAAKASIDADTPERWMQDGPTWETLGEWDATAPAAHIAAALAVRDAVLESLLKDAESMVSGQQPIGGMWGWRWAATSDWLRGYISANDPEAQP